MSLHCAPGGTTTTPSSSLVSPCRPPQLALASLVRFKEIKEQQTLMHLPCHLIVLGDDHALGVGGYSTLTGGSGTTPAGPMAIWWRSRSLLSAISIIVSMQDSNIWAFSSHDLLGIAHKMAKEFAKEVSIRQSWQIYNRGEYKTSTEDWLHPADSVCTSLYAHLGNGGQFFRSETLHVYNSHFLMIPSTIIARNERRRPSC